MPSIQMSSSLSFRMEVGPLPLAPHPNTHTCNIKLFIADRSSALLLRGWSGVAMALRKFPVPGRPLIWMIVGQGPTALAVGAGEGCLDIFFSLLSPSLWETARYRLKVCLKWPLNPKQPTNQHYFYCGSML